MACPRPDPIAFLDVFAFQPHEQDGKNEVLIIDRADGDLRLEASIPPSAEKGKSLDVWGK